MSDSYSSDVGDIDVQIVNDTMPHSHSHHPHPPHSAATHQFSSVQQNNITASFIIKLVLKVCMLGSSCMYVPGILTTFLTMCYIAFTMFDGYGLTSGMMPVLGLFMFLILVELLLVFSGMAGSTGLKPLVILDMLIYLLTIAAVILLGILFMAGTIFLVIYYFVYQSQDHESSGSLDGEGLWLMFVGIAITFCVVSAVGCVSLVCGMIVHIFFAAAHLAVDFRSSKKNNKTVMMAGGNAQPIIVTTYGGTPGSAL